jgi:DNA-directed RNA polymerase specialized sigma24 family protein
MDEASKTFVEGLFAYRGALQAFFYRRLRTKGDAADLVQAGACGRALRQRPLRRAPAAVSEPHRSAETYGARTEGRGVDQCVLSVIVPA